ncbi:MAG: tripartite tricarboxylate transporter substrate binding protein [Alphaproteobacteria bacterium]|nr:tripartite tricarboxylate transporter substrate binding protein [Alphaproteobacteria bacterium]
MTIRRYAIAAAFAGAVMLGVGPAIAQKYPDRSIEIIVPFNPGGGADSSQRTFNKFAEPIVGQSLVVVNKAGAGGTRGWAELVRKKADGYTLAIVTPPFNVIPALARPKQTGYTLDQFTNICIYAVVPDVILVREDSQYKTLADLVKDAKARPGKLKVANTGKLGADLMTTLMIEEATGAKFTKIPFTGGSKSFKGILSGTTDVMVASARFAVKGKGKLRTLAVTSPKRVPEFPNVPTFKELGYDIVSERYRAFAGPKGLPKKIVDYWGGVCEKVTKDAGFRAAMNKIGQPPTYRGPAQAQASIDSMAKRMKALVVKYDLAK